jgi:DNA-binding LacI/PurR family transcriptional regulator
VSVTNQRGAYQAVRHLLELGHRRIGFASGPLEYRYNQERLQGVRQAHAEAGRPFPPELMHAGDPTETGGAAAARAFLALPEPPTAVFAGNDLIAFGVQAEAARQGVDIPRDLSLAGFDDLPAAALARPALTTVRQPMYRIGLTAVEMLLALIEGRELAQTRVELDTELVVRDSTSAPAA